MGRVLLRSSPPSLPTRLSQSARLPSSPSTLSPPFTTLLPTTPQLSLPSTTLSTLLQLLLPSTTLSTLLQLLLPSTMLSTLLQLLLQLQLPTSQLQHTKLRLTPMRFPPTPSPTPLPMTTPSLTSTLRRPPMVPAMSRDHTLSLCPMAESRR